MNNVALKETLSCEQVTELLNYLEVRCNEWEEYSKSHPQPIDAYAFCRAELKNIKAVIKQLLISNENKNSLSGLFENKLDIPHYE